MKSPRIRLRSVGPQIKQSAWESRHRLRIGRMPDLEVRVYDPSISRVHAEVTLGRDGWVVRDLGSTNGTFVNGVRLGDEERQLNKRDLLQCGNIVMLVNLVEEGGIGVSPVKVEATGGTPVPPSPWEEAVDFLAWQPFELTRETASVGSPPFANACGFTRSGKIKSWEEAIEFSSLETTKRKPQRITSSFE